MSEVNLKVNFWEWGNSSVTKNLITRMNKKLAPLRAKNDVTHAIQLKLHERINKKVAETSYGRNKNHDDEIKKPREGQ